MKRFKRDVVAALFLFGALCACGSARAYWPGFFGAANTHTINNSGTLTSVGPNTLGGVTTISNLVVPGGYVAPAGNLVMIASGTVTASGSYVLAVSTYTRSVLVVRAVRTATDSPPGLSLYETTGNGGNSYSQTETGVSGVTAVSSATSVPLDLTDHNLVVGPESADVEFYPRSGSNWDFFSLSHSSASSVGHEREARTFGAIPWGTQKTVTLTASAHASGAYWLYAVNGTPSTSGGTIAVSVTGSLTGSGTSTDPVGVNSSSVPVYGVDGNLTVPYGVVAATVTTSARVQVNASTVPDGYFYANYPGHPSGFGTYAGGSFYGAGVYHGGSPVAVFQSNGGTSLGSYAAGAAAGTDGLNIPGSVGIGTNNPTTIFQVRPSADVNFRYTHDGVGGARVKAENDAGSAYVSMEISANPLKLNNLSRGDIYLGGAATRILHCVGGTEDGLVYYGSTGAKAVACTTGGGTLTSTPLVLP